jgi:hypothetical protein
VARFSAFVMGKLYSVRETPMLTAVRTAIDGLGTRTEE